MFELCVHLDNPQCMKIDYPPKCYSMCVQCVVSRLFVAPLYLDGHRFTVNEKSQHEQDGSTRL